MAENLFNHYADIPELQKETGKILDMFGQVKKGLLDLSKLGIKIDSAKSMAELNAQSKDYEALQQRILETQKQIIAQEEKLVRLNKQIAEGYKETGAAASSTGQAFGGINANILKQIELTNKLKETRAGIKKLEEFDAKINSPELTAQLLELKQNEATLKAEVADVNKFIRNQAKEFISASDSVDAMKARVAQLTQQFDAADEAFKQSEGGELLKKQINDLNAALDKELTSTDRFNQRVGNYAAAAKTVVDELNAINTQLESLKSRQSTLQSISEANPIGFKTGGSQSELDDISAQIQNLTVQATTLQEVANKPIFENAANDVKNSRAQIELLDTGMKQLAQTGNRDTEAFKNMRTQLFALLSQNNSARILVNAFGEVEKKLASLRERQKELNAVGFKSNAQVTELQKLEKELEQVEKEYTALDTILSKPQFLNVASKIGDATAETRYFTKALAELEMQGQQDTQQYRELQAELARLTDLMGDTREEVKALSSDTRGFDLAASAVGTLASTFQTVASSVELFGDNTQDVQKSVQKLMAIQNVANGIRQISVDLTTRGTAANKAYVFVQNLITVATNESATATARWMAILKGIGILALITALVWAADKMGLFGGETKETTNALDDFDAALDITNTKIEQNIAKMQRQIDLQIALAKQQGKSQKEIADISVEGLESQAKVYDDLAKKRQTALADEFYLGKLITSASEATKKFGIKDEEFEKIRAGNTTLEETRNILGEIAAFKLSAEFKALPEYAQNNVEFLLKSLKAVEDAQTNADDLRAQGTQANADELAREAEERRRLSKQRAEEAKRQFEAEKKYAVDLANFRLGIQADQQKGIKEGNVPTVSEDAAKLEFELRKKIIENTRDLELSSEKVTASQRKLIIEKAAHEISNLESAMGLDIIRIRTTLRDQDLALEKEYNDQLAQQEVDRIQRIQGINQALLSNRTNRANKETAELAKAANERFKSGLTNAEQYQNELYEIETNGQRKILEAQIEYYKDQIHLLEETGGNTLEMQTALAQAEEALSKLGIDNKKGNLQQQRDAIRALKDAYLELGKTLWETFTTVIAGSYDAAKNKIQEQIDQIDILRDRQVQQVQESGDAEEKKAARIALIDRKAQSDKEALERRQKQIDRQKAIFERASKAFSITTDTIVSVNKIRLEALAAINPALKAALYAQAFIAGAMGAAQLVALLATPIPKYAKGGKPKPGLGIVGEAGMEAVKYKGDRVKLFTEPTLTKFTGEEHIYPYSVTKRILHNTGFENHARNGGSVVVNLNQDEVVSELKKSNKKPPVTIVISDKTEATAYYMNNIKH